MMREGVWEGGEKLEPEEPVADLLKHGTLSLGFIGLAECMTAMYGRHHGQDVHVHREALNVIRTMRAFCDRMSELHNLNVTLFATPAEGLSGKFTKLDRARYGPISGVNEREYYTNSFHIPVYHDLPPTVRSNWKLHSTLYATPGPSLMSNLTAMYGRIQPPLCVSCSMH